MVRTELKKERHKKLVAMVNKNPFIKDNELAEALGVSIATIRIDRGELEIGEYRERVKNMAQNVSGQGSLDIVDMEPFHNGISIIKTDDVATYDDTDIIKGQALFGMAENLALDIINEKKARIRVANTKYIKEVRKGERLIAKFEVVRMKNKDFIIWVKIYSNRDEVFRCKFSLSA